MKKKKKKFDCVEMKWKIQNQLQEEFKEVPEKEARQRQLQRIARNPILGPVLKKVPIIKSVSDEATSPD